MNLPKYKLNDQLIAKSDDNELYIGAVDRITAEKAEKDNYTYFYEVDGNTFSEQVIVATNTVDQWYLVNQAIDYVTAKDLF